MPEEVTPLESTEADALRAARRLAAADGRRRATTSRRRLGASLLLVLVALGMGVVWVYARQQSKLPSAAATQLKTAAAVPTAAAAPAAVSTATAAAETATALGANVATAPVPSADATAWEKPYLGKLVLGFKPREGYRAVALTFDDGPNQATKYVIQTVQKYGGHATFFFTGRNLMKYNQVRQATMVENAGFELGDHTQDHMPNDVSAIWHKSYATDVYQITQPDVLIEPYVHHPTLWLRPPGGGIDDTGLKAAADTGHLVINWTVDSNDSHGGKKSPDEIYQACTTDIRSGDVILLHVTHPESMEALPRICATLTQEGFNLVTVSELAENSAPLARH